MKRVEIRARHAAPACEAALPADIAIFAAAVADWRVANDGEQKLKKTAARHAAAAAGRKSRYPRDDLEADRRSGRQLVIGFAAETEHLIDNAKAKLARKGCDWIVANDVSPATGVMGGDRNTVHLLTRDRHGDISGGFLAGDDQGTGRDRTGGADRRNRIDVEKTS